MARIARRALGAFYLFALVLLLATPSDAQRELPRFVTGPINGDPLRIALDHMPEGVDFVLESRRTNPRSGITHMYFTQRIDGIEVLGADFAVHVSRNGEIIALHDRFVAPPGRRAAARSAALSPQQAISAAATQLGLPAPATLMAMPGPGGGASGRFDAAGVSREPVEPVLRYLRTTAGELRWVWSMQIQTTDRAHHYECAVDAATGELLDHSDWTRNDAYRVFASPLESPLDGPRTLEVNPADPAASPLGWHDLNGLPGADLLDTRGNNVNAQEDVNGDNVGTAWPSGGLGLVFDYPLDLQGPVAAQQAPGIVNLFYWNNWLHDAFFAYGFDTAAGNFQVLTYGAPGSGLDAIQADSQDGAGRNNARFTTPPDGTSGRMEMFLFDPSATEVVVATPASIAGRYPAGAAEFGGVLTQTGLTGEIVIATDAIEPGGTSTDACSAITNGSQVAGRIAFVDRGGCLFIDKVQNAQAAGAIAAIVANIHDAASSPGNNLINMSGTAPGITIPSVFMSWSNGQLIRNALGQGVTATASATDPNATIDSAFSNTIIIHEYGHGVSVRLTGGPSIVTCLDEVQSRGMGEGWSDYFAINLTQKTGQTRATPRAVGTWPSGEPPAGSGFRNFQFSTDLAVSPQTYADIAGTNQPHGVGEIFANALWEVHWNLVDQYGFDSDLVHGSGGNNLMLQLVMDGLALQPCEPTFLDARDAILLADQNLTQGANQCAIHRGFAKRGMGVSAADGGAATSLQITEAFDVPIACPEPGAGLLAAAAVAALAAVRRAREPRRTRHR